MNAKTNAEERTAAAIRKEISELQARRHEVTKELAAIFKARKGSPMVMSSPQADRAKTVRARALALLGAPNVEIESADRETALEIDRDAIDVAIKSLTRDETARSAAEAVEWGERNRPRWNALVRELALSVARLEGVGEKINAMEREVEPGSVLMPLSEYIGNLEIYLCRCLPREFLADAVSAGIVSQTDLRKARVVQ